MKDGDKLRGEKKVLLIERVRVACGKAPYDESPEYGISIT
jgi:hypothetical protein